MARHAERRPPRGRHHISAACAALLCAAGACAQSDGAVQSVVVTGRGPGSATPLAGFGDVSAWRAPFATASLGEQALKDLGAAAAADLTRWDASVGDAYNAPGYWSQFTVRGFVLDPRYNMRRDGLPINGETVLGMDSVAALQVLKGTTGIQAGTSAPGGLVNLVVKRPVGRLRTFEVGWRESGEWTTSADVGDRSAGIGWRVNATLATLDPKIDAARGHRRQFAAAFDIPAGNAGRWEAEIETFAQVQPSVPGLSLLGDRLPDPAHPGPNANLNRQRWSLPVDSRGDTASLRWTLELSPGLAAQAHAMTQRLRTDDRIAFPFGCSASNQFDRYCADGSFDLYDYRSEGERRRSDALDLSLRWTSAVFDATGGLLATRQTSRFNRQAFNWVGVGNIDGRFDLPPDPSQTTDVAQRDEDSLEAYARARIALAERTQLFAGLRSTRLKRDSALPDGSQATHARQSLATPWLALSQEWAGGWLAYASWGQGVESAVVPNLPGLFSNAGAVLPALKSRQAELGLRWHGAAQDASLVAFDIDRPVTADLNGARVIDGSARHRGLEAAWDAREGPWTWHASAMGLHARRQGSAVPGLDGRPPTNVPERSLRLQATRDIAAVPGLNLQATLTHEGARHVLPDSDVSIPSWTRIDLGARWIQRLREATVTWRAGIDNAADRKAWKESPYQFGHAYLFPLPARAVRLSAQIDL